MISRLMTGVRRYADPICFWIVFAALVLSPVGYWAVLNSYGDSTDYFLQEVSSATTGPDGRKYLYIGDPLHVTAYNYRHRLNGTCLLEVDRIRENVGGKYDDKRTVFQHVRQQFVGDGRVRRTYWPIPPVEIKITDDWFDDPDATEQEIDIFTAGTYECNPLDRFWKKIGWPRILHDQDGNPQRERTRVVLKRKREG